MRRTGCLGAELAPTVVSPFPIDIIRPSHTFAMNRRTLVRVLVAAPLALLLGACGGDDGGPAAPSEQSVAGTWNLQSINGVRLPFVIEQSGLDKVEVVGETYTLTNTGTFTQVTQYRATIDGRVTNESEVDAGSYVLNGTALTIHWNSGGQITASVSGRQLTATQDGLAVVYQKQ